jgi:hypothetical protein
MGTSRGEVHDLLLVHAEDGMHTRLHQQGKMGIGTKAPVGHQDITGAQLRMESDHFGEIMGAQGAANICKTSPVLA